MKSVAIVEGEREAGGREETEGEGEEGQEVHTMSGRGWREAEVLIVGRRVFTGMGGGGGERGDRVRHEHSSLWLLSQGEKKGQRGD